ncbi:MAG TPA: ATP-binding protein [Thermoanaerobaculia bacterium]|nr:ATP-binding protein [Thermoanaerobaculia bacterium]
MIVRVLEARLRELAGKFPIVTVTGPRQSGKTTLCRAVFPDKPYASLEAPDVQEYARGDPRGFLAEYPDGAVLDEVHRVPELLSYLQPLVDEEPAPGRFVLTGSANFALLQSLGQSLAGRTALLDLLPLSLEEIRRFPEPPNDLTTLLWRGSYPSLYDRGLEPGDWYPSYVATYLERDVRTLLAVGDLLAFQTFLRLCAGRVGQLVNFSNLAAEAGVTHNTSRAWLSVLEAGYVTWRLPPFHANVSKRLVKAPKLHFVDSGLVCYLLGIRSADQLRDHPLRGAIFETWVASEILKSRVHRGLPPSLLFFRDAKGSEVDLVVEDGRSLFAIETKSGRTIAGDFFGGLEQFRALAAEARPDLQTKPFLVYGGAEAQKRTLAEVIPWSELDRHAWWRDPWQPRPPGN